jgi:hypothetical protein
VASGFFSMELKPFRIIAMPFAQSTVEAEFTEYAVDEDAAFKQFEQRYPLFRIKEVREE